MTEFKEFLARFAQNVCILTLDNLGDKRSCTISSFNSVSASIEQSIFAFALTQDSLMASIVRENSRVTVTLLSDCQSNVASYYVKNRFDSGRFAMNRVAIKSIGVVTGRISKAIPVGSSTLYLAEVQGVKLTQVDSRPLIYRLRNYNL